MMKTFLKALMLDGVSRRKRALIKHLSNLQEENIICTGPDGVAGIHEAKFLDYAFTKVDTKLMDDFVKRAADLVTCMRLEAALEETRRQIVRKVIREVKIPNTEKKSERDVDSQFTGTTLTVP